MSKPQVGVLYPVSEVGTREAYHMPAIICHCGYPVSPGERVKFLTTDGKKVYIPEHREDADGIVDPFLPSGASPGQAFLVFPLPQKVSEGVRHYFDVEGLDNTQVLQKDQIAVNRANYDCLVKEAAENTKPEIPPGYALIRSTRLRELEGIEERFNGYDDEYNECRGCY